MARIDQLRYDDQIPGSTVALGLDGGVVDKAVAIAEAHRRGQHLGAVWSGGEDEPVSCSYQRLAPPPRWELVPAEPVDPDPTPSPAGCWPTARTRTSTSTSPRAR